MPATLTRRLVLRSPCQAQIHWDWALGARDATAQSLTRTLAVSVANGKAADGAAAGPRRAKMGLMPAPRVRSLPLRSWSDSLRGGRWLLLAALGGAAACGAPAAQAPSKPAKTPAAVAAQSPEAELRAARIALDASRYGDAERGFRALIQAPGATAAQKLDAELGLAETLLVTGRYEDAVTLAREAARRAPTAQGGALRDPRSSLLVVAAEGLRRNGELDEALSVLEGASKSSLDALLLQGEILLLGGHRKRAESALLEVVGAYNDERIAEGDGRSLALVGRAAHLMRSPHDANDAFDAAETATPNDVRTLLWRAELFLEKYDLAHASEVLEEALALAPHHPEALVSTAQLRLAETLDFDAAVRLAKEALTVDPRLSSAYFVLGGVALRDEDPNGAEAQANAGLRFNPRDLELLSLRATARFLKDDRAGFEAQVAEVLAQNPEYTRIFQIVGEFADWEHRYDEIVSLMRRAVRIDPEDGKARADLGLNLIRAGQDAAGVVELRRAFEADPFNVRVYNTLELYEKIIPRDYAASESGRFRIRYPKGEKALLERYVPQLLERAFDKLVKRYGFTPETPIGVELYQNRAEFAVRTSGLPQTEIQGVCFGRTLATLTPAAEPSNLGMTLWHELSHVFHIQMTKAHVPRWLTEGLAEHETAIERPEWRRELDPELYDALRNDRLPELAHMTRAFTRAEDMADIATAYYASTRITDFLDQKFGMPRVTKLLRAYGAGETTEGAAQNAFATPTQALDAQFRKHLGVELQRFERQFVPLRPRGSLPRLKAALQKAPKDPQAQIAYAQALFASGEVDEGKRLLAEVLTAHPKDPDALFTRARIDLADGKRDVARKALEALVQNGSDGYEVRILLARLASDPTEQHTHLLKARDFDPSSAAALYGLLKSRVATDDERLAALARLTTLEEHDFETHGRYVEMLLERKRYADAVRAGEAAIWSNLEDARLHQLFARALEASGDKTRALFEYESAALCPSPPEERAVAYETLAEAQERLGRPKDAKKSRAEAAALRAAAATAPAPSASPSAEP